MNIQVIQHLKAPPSQIDDVRNTSSIQWRIIHTHQCHDHSLRILPRHKQMENLISSSVVQKRQEQDTF